MFSLSDIESPIILKNIVENKLSNITLSNEEFKDRINIVLPFLENLNLKMQNIVLAGSAVYENIKYENILDIYYTPINSVSIYVIDGNIQNITNFLCDYLYKYWTDEGFNMTITRTSNYYLFKNNAIIADEVIIYTNIFNSISELLESIKIDCYGCVWDGEHIYMNARAKASLETNSIIFKNDYSLNQLRRISLLFVHGMNIVLSSLDDLHEFNINGLFIESSISATANSITVKRENSFSNPLATIKYDGELDIHNIQPIITLDNLLQAIKIDELIFQNLTFEEIKELKKEIEPILKTYVTIINNKLFFI